MQTTLKLMVFSTFVFPFVLFNSLSMAAELIEPTRSLDDSGEIMGRLTVLSEPPGLDITLDGAHIGKTPTWQIEVKPGLHKLQVKDEETDIHVAPSKTLQISLYKGDFIYVPVEEEKVTKQPEPPEKKTSRPRVSKQPVEKRRSGDLTPWERFLNGTLPSF